MKLFTFTTLLLMALTISSCGQAQKVNTPKEAEIILDTTSPYQALLETLNSERRICSKDKECKIKDTCDLSKKTCKESGLSCQKNFECEIKGNCENRVCRY